MNKELLLKIADHIEQHPDEYAQTDFGAVERPNKVLHCQTPCCIAGLAVILSETTLPKITVLNSAAEWCNYKIRQRASEVLAIHDESWLFNANWPLSKFPERPTNREFPYRVITAETAIPRAGEAVQILRLIAEGEIDTHVGPDG